MRILGIDPGSLNTGLAVQDLRGGSVSRIYGAHSRPPEGREYWRCRWQAKAIGLWLNNYSPDVVCMESPAYGYADGGIKSSLLYGCLLHIVFEYAEAATKAVNFYYVPPTKLKWWATGSGKAGKGAMLRYFDVRPHASIDVCEAFIMADFGTRCEQLRRGMIKPEKKDTVIVDPKSGMLSRPELFHFQFGGR
jgi:Holliday junction resolvasome RuvABC endonuclease subunit